LIIGFEVKGLRKAFLIASKEVGIVKRVCCSKRIFSDGKEERQFRSGVNKTAQGLLRSGLSNLR
jgi:hypothetical protein